MINLGDGLTDGAFIKDRLLVNQARHESGRADLVDAAGNALGVFKDTLQGVAGVECTSLVPSDRGQMLDIADGLFQIKRAEVVAHTAPLIEGRVDREMVGVEIVQRRMDACNEARFAEGWLDTHYIMH